LYTDPGLLLRQQVIKA